MTTSTPTLVRVEPHSYERGPAYDVLLDGVRIGRVAAYDHTYRTTYAYSRIGYDRHHVCWWGDRVRPGTYSERYRCYLTRAKLVELIVKDYAP